LHFKNLQRSANGPEHASLIPKDLARTQQRKTGKTAVKLFTINNLKISVRESIIWRGNLGSK
jgi:hypothetical protein